MTEPLPGPQQFPSNPYGEYPTPDQQPADAQQRPGYPPPDAEPPNPSPARPRRTVLPVLTGLIGAIVGAGVTVAIMLPLTDPSTAAPKSLADEPSDILTQAAQACDLPMGVNVQDDGVTLVFDHEGEDDFAGGDLEDIMCVFTELDMPSRIRTHMSQTTSMDGRQTASWDNLEVQWSYHPDRGLDGMVTLVEE